MCKKLLLLLSCMLMLLIGSVLTASAETHTTDTGFSFIYYSGRDLTAEFTSDGKQYKEILSNYSAVLIPYIDKENNKINVYALSSNPYTLRLRQIVDSEINVDLETTIENKLSWLGCYANSCFSVSSTNENVTYDFEYNVIPDNMTVEEYLKKIVSVLKIVEGEIATNPDNMLDDDSFALTGFTATSDGSGGSIHASWTGTTHDDVIDTYNHADVGIRPAYSLKAYPTQIADRGTVMEQVDVSAKSWSQLYDAVNPADEDLYLRYLEFIPNYQKEPLSPMYVGKSCFVYFNADGSVEKIVNEYVPEESIYDKNIPTPKIVMTGNGYEFGFNNTTDDYYIEMQGRWYTVDDIELFKENLMWKYKYNTLLKTNLENWVVKADKKKATAKHDLSFYGASTFDNLLSSYPIDSRNYSGGTNSVGNYFSGYSNAMDTLKMLLKVPTSLYNGAEIYVRYYVIDESGNVFHGKWCHWFDDLADADGSSGSDIDDNPNGGGNGSDEGLDDEDKDKLEEGDDSRDDDDVKPDNPSNNFDDFDLLNIGKKLIESILELFGYVKNIPALIASCFSFLPSWVIGLIGLGLLIAVLLRIFGR